MTPLFKLTLPVLLVIVLLVLLTGCASVPPTPSPGSATPLPPRVRPKQPPPICSPTCSDGLAKLLDNLLTTPKPPE